MGVKVKDALKIGGLKGAKVLSGHGGLNNEIKHVDVIEMPDIVKWLRSNTLMLTTFYAFKDDKEAQINIIRKMAEAGVAGLVIDPRIYLGKLPEEILQLSDELNLPIIELPHEVGYIDVITPIVNTILDWESQLYSKSKQMNELFTNIILKKGSFQGISDTLSEFTDCSLIILDKYSNILAWTDSKPGDNDELEKLINEGDMIALLKAAGIEKDDVNAALRREVKYKDENVVIMLVPIKIGMEIYGYIIFWNFDRTFNEINLIALEQASKVTAIELIKREAVQENQKRQEAVFFTKLLNGDFDSEEEIYNKAENMNISLYGVGSVIVVEICQMNKDLCMQNKIFLTDIMEQFRFKLSSLQNLIVIGNNKRIVILPKLEHNVDKDAARDLLIKIGENIKAEVEEDIGYIKVTVGIGRYYDKLTEIKKSYNEAKNALIISKKLFNSDGGILHFDQLGLYKLLTKLEDEDELKTFYKETLYPLTKYDKENKTDLVGTLQKYFACGENLTVTAEKLYIHINTLKYRMNRIKEILDIDDFAMENKTSLFIALKIMHLLNGD